jgi:hypothetical protein
MHVSSEIYEESDYRLNMGVLMILYWLHVFKP